MVAIRDPKTHDASERAPLMSAENLPHGYEPGPSLVDVLGGSGVFQRGDSGDGVRALQQLLNALGIEPPLEPDGLFGPKTEAAVMDLQRRMNTFETGRVNGEMWAGLEVERALMGSQSDRLPGGQREPLRAPRFGARAPAGSMSAGSLAQNDDARRARARSTRTNGGANADGANPNGANPEIGTGTGPEVNGAPANGAPANGVGAVQPAPGQNRADAELQALQSAAVGSAQRELAAGVRADQGPNRGARVDQYARDGGMPVGGAWCGYFTGFNYAEAARNAGGRFNENIRFHSFQKARSYFEYRNYTNNSSAENQRLDRLQAQHQAEGSTRRWMTLEGSTGQRHAEQYNRPHEVYRPENLPIRPGDTALFNRGHVGMVESYDPNTQTLVTIEGNSQNAAVNRNTYHLDRAEDRAKFDGFGRPARGDFDLPGGVPAREQPQPGQPQAPLPVSPAENASPNASSVTLALPPRRADAMTGSEFMERTKNMSRRERERFILHEIENGNVPDFARQMREVQVSAVGRDGQTHTGTVRVMPDYLAIGSNEDFVRIPMNPITAQKIADQTGTSLPTRKLVDDVYRQADVQLRPQPMQAGAQMMSNDYYARHNQMVEDQRRTRGAELGALTAGHQKDLVISNALTAHPDRVAIYGWHQPNGRPIQPLSTIHENTYADYSHGVRLVAGTMIVDGVERPVADVLRDPNLAGLVSDEGVIRDPRVPRN